MTRTRALAWIAAAAFGLGLAAASPAAAQYHDPRDGYAPRGDVYGGPGNPRYGSPRYGNPHYDAPRQYHVPPPPVSRGRPLDPYYGNVPSVRKYGHGPNRHWRRWTRNKHPGWVPPQHHGWGHDGWARPRYFDYR